MPNICLPTAPATPKPTGPANAASLPELWGRLPPEVQERVMATWDGPDVLQAVRVASQVHPVWHARLRHTQPRSFHDLQQQLWMMEATQSIDAAPTKRTTDALRDVTQMQFKGASRREFLERDLLNVSDARLQALGRLMPSVRGCNLQGLKEGPALFARWAAQSSLFANIECLQLDFGHLTYKGIRTLLQGAQGAPRVRRVAVTGTPTQRNCTSPTLAALNPRLEPLDFACWPDLEVLDLHNAGMYLGKLRLDRNPHIRQLSVHGNDGTGIMLFSGLGPQTSLRSLTVSVDLWQPQRIQSFKDASWAQSLTHLEFVPAAVELIGLDLRNYASLQSLTISGQPVDYSTLHLPSSALRTLAMTNTSMCDDNCPKSELFAQPQLRRLLLGVNTLTELLNTLNLDAAGNLEMLDLSHARLRDADIAAWVLPQDCRLTHLELSDNCFTGAVWGLLAQKPLRRLRYLGLRLGGMRKQNTLVDSIVSLGDIRRLFPSLRGLSVFIHGVRPWQKQDKLAQLFLDAGITQNRVDLMQLPDGD